MAQSKQWQGIPTSLTEAQFIQFVLPYLTVGRRGPASKLTLYAIFNYILHLLYIGCQWKELPIRIDPDGQPEIHYTRIYRFFRRWAQNGRWRKIEAAVGRRSREIESCPSTWKFTFPT